MNSTVQGQIELSAVLNLIPYLDTDFNYDCEMSLADIVAANEKKFKNDDAFKILKTAIEQNPSYGEILLVDQSSTNNTGKWTDDLIQGCTFKDPDGNYYVAYRGTGDGRWADNGNGMTVPSTEMQEAAREYFDAMAEKYFVDANAEGKQIIVTGHSKGGNEAQYVYMTSEYEYLIDSCYSHDGQGFSGSAREHFIEKYGPDYEEKLSHMYSICGEDDYVHDLGYVIIPEENTYFVETSSSGFASLHALENMIGDEDGNYTGLQWDIENGEITNGEQGDIGKLAKKISETMMQMDDEDLNGAAIAVMTLIDPYANDDILGSIDVSWTDYVDLAAHGLPAVLETLFLTEEGNVILGDLINAGAEYLYENYGAGGVVAGFALGSILLTFVVAPLVLDIVVLANILDFAIDTVNKIKEISEKIKNYISDIKEAVVAAINKIIAKLKSMSAGYKYATANPQIIVDTYKLGNYAQRLRTVNTRISNLDRRLDSLYWRVGLLDLWNLMQADILTGYSWRLSRCASYLSDTATDFVNAENDLVSKVQ